MELLFQFKETFSTAKLPEPVSFGSFFFFLLSFVCFWAEMQVTISFVGPHRSPPGPAIDEAGSYLLCLTWSRLCWCGGWHCRHQLDCWIKVPWCLQPGLRAEFVSFFFSNQQIFIDKWFEARTHAQKRTQRSNDFVLRSFFVHSFILLLESAPICVTWFLAFFFRFSFLRPFIIFRFFLACIPFDKRQINEKQKASSF